MQSKYAFIEITPMDDNSNENLYYSWINKLTQSRKNWINNDQNCPKCLREKGRVKCLGITLSTKQSKKPQKNVYTRSKIQKH